MISPRFFSRVCVLAVLAAPVISAARSFDDIVYKSVAAMSLHAHVFRPETKPTAGKWAAIVLFHGGGWSEGSAEWTDHDAEHYAVRGMVAVSGDYRLSDQKEVTPLEAMADARDLIRWVRAHAGELNVDPGRIAAYGVSAGGHLAASAAVFPQVDESSVDAKPNALVLLSPAVSLTGDNWVKRLLIDRADARTISPVDHVHGPLPPVLIVNGDADLVTPLGEAERFRDAVVASGSTCELIVYRGVGHLLTRKLDRHSQEMGPFETDPADKADAQAKMDAFLAKLGYLQSPKS